MPSRRLFLAGVMLAPLVTPILGAPILGAMPAGAQTAAQVTLHSAEGPRTLQIEPTSWGNRTSYDGELGQSLTFAFLATSEVGEWIVSISLDGDAVVGSVLIPPGGVARAARDPQVALSALSMVGDTLQVAGEIADAGLAQRLVFALDLPHIDFAPTPGPGAVPPSPGAASKNDGC